MPLDIDMDFTVRRITDPEELREACLASDSCVQTEPPSFFQDHAAAPGLWYIGFWDSKNRLYGYARFVEADVSSRPHFLHDVTRPKIDFIPANENPLTHGDFPFFLPELAAAMRVLGPGNPVVLSPNVTWLRNATAGKLELQPYVLPGSLVLRCGCEQSLHGGEQSIYAGPTYRYPKKLLENALIAWNGLSEK